VVLGVAMPVLRKAEVGYVYLNLILHLAKMFLVQIDEALRGP